MAVTLSNDFGSPLPPFPTDVPTHPLLVIDFNLIKASDEAEIDRLWEAATKLGFWYLKNHGCDDSVVDMFAMGAETMDLPLEEKIKFEAGDAGKTWGYKAKGATVVDAAGNRDTVEFITVNSDDAMHYPEVRQRTYPDTCNKVMKSVIRPFVEQSMEVNNVLLRAFEKKLGLPAESLVELHTNVEASEARCIKSGVIAGPPPTEAEAKKPHVALLPHTDFGSLSFLHNRLGGLQVLVPKSEEWQYIKPIPGHAICNVGDSLCIYSGGLLRSNMHRVVKPPKEQALYDRWSLVYFTRPATAVPMRALKEKSTIIAEHVKQCTEFPVGAENFETGVTSGEWFTRRAKFTRTANRTGVESWRALRGTEHTQEE
jgi:isopenicillin N synthase-like dioxygenase